MFWVHSLMFRGGFIEKANFIFRQNSGFSSQYYRNHRGPITKKKFPLCIKICEMLDLFGGVYGKRCFLGVGVH